MQSSVVSTRPGYKHAMSRSYGFGHETWAEMLARYETPEAIVPDASRAAAPIVRSILSEGAADLLVGSTTLDGLVVRPVPVPELPYDVVLVRVAGESVLITHRSVTGRDDQIERPASELVPLFWRFMIEKFGIHPAHDSH
jgi:hypothetical protein